MTNNFKRFLLGGFLFVVTLTILEFGVRLWGYSGHRISDPIYMPFELTGDIPYVHKPNLVNARAQGLSIINTDSQGLRSKVVGAQYGPKTKEEYRIAIVGDSGTFGEGVSKTEGTYPQILEDALNRSQSVLKAQGFNYGVSAYRVKEMAATLEHRMLEIAPDLVVMTIIDHDFVLARTPTVDVSGYLENHTSMGGLFPILSSGRPYAISTSRM
ncbi:MAG: SGNH/GDSL hydrolase family protein [Nitrospirales bacterium]|nr:SGNH/GDSL hydrolase family protein [Nitrospirales bacterium]